MFGLLDGLPAGALTVLAGYATLLVVPGPSMMMVAVAGLSSPARGAAAALGVATGTGILVFAMSLVWSLNGIATEFSTAAPLLFSVTLLYLGQRLLWRSLQHGTEAKAVARRPDQGGFLTGLATALTNPIGLALFSTASTNLNGGGGSVVAACGCIFLMAVMWFLLIAHLSGRIGASAIPQPARAMIGGGAGIVLVVIATWTALDVLTELRLL